MKNFNVRYECLDFRDDFHAQKIRNEVQLTIISKESEDSVLANTNVCSTDPVSKALFEEDDVDMNTHFEYKDPRWINKEIEMSNFRNELRNMG